MRILITGGAGFVGNALANYFSDASKKNEIVIFDNLYRRGSEWNLGRLSQQNITFVHGDVRSPSDFNKISGNFDVLIAAASEPSVHAGLTSSPRFVFDTNLVGIINTLEFAIRRCACFIFLSSSRIFSIPELKKVPLVEEVSRFDFDIKTSSMQGVSWQGVNEMFSTHGVRSYYGTSKLAAELIVQEYGANHKLPTLINRCGVIAGPGQFGKADQGVYTMWLARHIFGRPLSYRGFGGHGFQVRDLLHPTDLAELVEAQIKEITSLSGETFNIGGGRKNATSLLEFTKLCQDKTGNEVNINREAETNIVDIPWYVSDHQKISNRLGWHPTRSLPIIIDDTYQWIKFHEEFLSGLII